MNLRFNYRSFLIFAFTTQYFLNTRVLATNSISPPYSRDTTKPKSALKPYRDIIPKNVLAKKGFVTIDKVDDRWYLELPDSVLGREILVVSRIARGAADVRTGTLGYAGDEINENTVTFTRGIGNKIFLINMSCTEIAQDSSADGLFRSVNKSNMQPIIAAFDVKAICPESGAVVFDMTDYLNGDNNILFFAGALKKALGLGALQSDRSFIETMDVFTSNMEVRTVKTYVRTVGQSPPEPVTFEVNSSMVLLPKISMRPRYFDPRIGYFATTYLDFDENPQRAQEMAMITRWRLQPKDKDAYLNGQLCEPVRPIVYYIDPVTPKKWIRYLKQGVTDWNIAFEHAGFKNAILAKEAPIDDSTWNIDDAAHNVIVYKPSIITNASGPNVHDPRTGEILETHINWYHNVMKLVHDWYLIQAGAVDARARKPVFDDTLMGQLIRYVVSHEVGHTLGLRHNFGASSSVPVDSLRSKNYLHRIGHSPSIMDYSRFNYVAQPEDGIPPEDLIPGIRAYDCWAIEWGYRWFPEGETRDAERIRLDKWVMARASRHPELRFGTETDQDDPRNQSEDLGDDAMKAGAYGIRNLQRILPQLPEWTKEPAKGYDALQEMYGALVNQFSRYMTHVEKNIGGVMTNPKTIEEAVPVVRFVSRAKQQQAMAFLQTELFNTPKWLLDSQIFTKTDVGIHVVLSVQAPVLGYLLSNATLERLIRFETVDPVHAYTPDAMLTDLENGIWHELTIHKSIEMHRRDLQKIYIEKMISVLTPPMSNLPSGFMTLFQLDDEGSLLRAHATHLLSHIRSAIPLTHDTETKWHLEDCAFRLEKALHPK